MNKWLAMFFLGLMVWVNVPRQYWHACDHLATIEASHDGTDEVHENDDCAICSFVFSATPYLCDQPDAHEASDCPSLWLHATHDSCSVGVATFDGRAPPRLV